MCCARAPDQQGVACANRAVRIAICAAMLLVATAHAQGGADPPIALGGIAIGTRWDTLEPQRGRDTLDHLTTAWDHHTHACGYRTVRIAAPPGELLVTVQDFVVTELSYAEPIAPGSDVRVLGDRLLATYGQPARAEMRDRFGRITIGQNVNAVLLEYPTDPRLLLTLTGEAVWRQTTTIRHPDHRWYENRTLRCARERDTPG